MKVPNVAEMIDSVVKNIGEGVFRNSYRRIMCYVRTIILFLVRNEFSIIVFGRVPRIDSHVMD